MDESPTAVHSCGGLGVGRSRYWSPLACDGRRMVFGVPDIDRLRRVNHWSLRGALVDAPSSAHRRCVKEPSCAEHSNTALGALGGAGVSVVAFTAAQLLLGFTWGMVCRALDCSMSDFMNVWVLVPMGVIGLSIAVYVGWLSDRKMYRSLEGLSRP